MKTVIRKGVFETNSSSTHALAFSDSEPDEYTFECASPWSRLLMLKALVNAGGVDDTEDDEDEESCESGWNVKEPAEDEMLPESRTINRFYDICLDVFCEREKVEKENIAEYLALKLIEGTESKHSRAFIDEFVSNYRRYGSERLCECMFGQGCLDFCNCGFDYHRRLLTDVAGIKDCSDEDSLCEAAKEYLLGKKRFFGTENYNGFMLLDDKERL